MFFIWKDIAEKDFAFVETFLDDEAVKNTGIDEEFQDFYNYWKTESQACGYGFWCKVVYDAQNPIGVISFGDGENCQTVISSIIVTPEFRGIGFGSKILKEFTTDPMEIFGKQQNRFTAVIYKNNIPSQKAFEKAGFRHTSTHNDGDCLNYEFIK